MKIIFAIIAAVLITAGAFAQAPEKMSYQAVVRDADNALVINQAVGMQISILQAGTAVYVETQTPTTNANGMISLEIGAGTIVSGDFTTIDWANGAYFIKTEIDPTSGTTYTITGTSQLISVPYALHANTAETAGGHYIGELFGGGIVYYVYDNGTHGLIASLDDLHIAIGNRWGSGTNDITEATNHYDGEANTSAITDVLVAGFAAHLCEDYSNGGFSDWYLPSIIELGKMYQAILTINNILANDGDDTTNPLHPEFVFPIFGSYWSSREHTVTHALGFDFLGGVVASPRSKSLASGVRAVRAF